MLRTHGGLDMPSIGCKIYSNPDSVAKFDRPGDYAATGIQAQAYLTQIPDKNNRMIIIPRSTTNTATITTTIGALGYDLAQAELGDCTVAELAAALAAVRVKATALNAKLVVAPSVYYWQSHTSKALDYWNALVDAADVLMPQGKAYQATSIEAYRVAYVDRIEIARKRKDIVIFCDLSPSPQDITVTVEAMRYYWWSVRAYVDGVYVTHADTAAEHAVTKDFFEDCGR